MKTQEFEQVYVYWDADVYSVSMAAKNLVPFK